MKQDGWAERVTAVIAGEVRAQRERLKMSAQRLSDRCAELGYPIPRNTISNLENSRKEAVSVAELLTLAAALQMPPIALLCPVWGRPADGGDAVELLPGETLDRWAAMMWFVGRYGFSLPAAELESTKYRFHHNDAVDVIDLLWQHADAVEWRLTTEVELDDHRILKGLGEPPQAALEQRRRQDQVIATCRRDLRSMGAPPPPLPDELRYIDKLPVRGGKPS